MRRGAGVLQRQQPGQGAAQAPRLDEAGRVAGLREMRLQNQDAPGDGGQHIQEFARLVQVIEQTAAENRVEYPVGCRVPHIVADELQVRKIDFGLHVTADLDIGFAHVDPQGLESEPRELHRVAALETAQIGDAQAGLVGGKRGVENALGGEKPGMGIDRQPLVGLGVGAVVQSNVVGGKLHQRWCSPTPATSRARDILLDAFDYSGLAPHIRCAAVIVLASSMVTVMGPTPPGTGVM